MTDYHTWAYVSLPHATFALLADGDDDRVTDAPPIARWTIGKDIDTVIGYYTRRFKGARYEISDYAKGD